jgi:hypothetical protein
VNEAQYQVGDKANFWDGIKLHRVTIAVVAPIAGRYFYTFQGLTVQGTSTGANLWPVLEVAA